MTKKPLALGLGLATALALVAVNVATQAAQAAPITIVSTPTAPNGWYTEDGAPAYVSSPTPIDGQGQLEYNTPTDTSKNNYFHLTGPAFASGVPLAGVSGVSYSVQNSSGGPEAAYDMEVLTTGTSGYTTLVWEPYVNGHPLVADGAWHTYSNLESGLWWSTHISNPAPGSQSSPQPLSFFQGLYPNATVATYGVGQGSHNAGSVSYVDDVSFEGTTTNFEPWTTDCRARAYSGVGPRPIVLAEANGAEVPCTSQSTSVVSVSASVPAVLTSIKAGVLNARTSYTLVDGVPVSAASASVASVSLIVGGIPVKITGIQSSAVSSQTSCDGGTPLGTSSVAKVTIAGKTYNVGSKPFSIKLGALGAIQFNNQEIVGNRVVQRAVLLGYSDHRYNFSFAESIAGVSC